MSQSSKKYLAFQNKVLTYYKEHGRSLPWRKTTDPYRILVSEIMLQQTQVDRVIPKYQDFIQRFPTTTTLAKASLKDVLKLWQGLGYNRRAKMLHQAAKHIVKECNGRFPKDIQELQKIPGVGPYTSAAVLTFAFNKSVPFIETNVRTVYLDHFFKNKTDVSDTEVLTIVEKTMGKNPREWGNALMDYGAMLKQKKGKTNTKSKHYTKQSKFKGSNRELRGKVLRFLSLHEKGTAGALLKYTNEKQERLSVVLSDLEKENLISRSGRSYMLG